MTRRRSTALHASLALGAALLAGCAGGGTTTAVDPATDPAAPTSAPATQDAGDEPRGPACSEVWRAGATLPGGYDGCDDAGTWVPEDGRYCEFGKPLVTHERYYAVPGGRIAEADGELRRDPGYRDVLRKCSG